MKAIVTKYHGPGNVKGARISADDGDGNRVMISYPYSLSGDAVHFEAVKALCCKMGWSGSVVSGGLTGGSRVWVFVFNPLKNGKTSMAVPVDVTAEEWLRQDYKIESSAEAADYGVNIAWGSDSMRDENPDTSCEYSFKTQAELDAFMYGVDESSGWMEYEVTEKALTNNIKRD